MLCTIGLGIVGLIIFLVILFISQKPSTTITAKPTSAKKPMRSPQQTSATYSKCIAIKRGAEIKRRVMMNSKPLEEYTRLHNSAGLTEKLMEELGYGDDLWRQYSNCVGTPQYENWFVDILVHMKTLLLFEKYGEQGFPVAPEVMTEQHLRLGTLLLEDIEKAYPSGRLSDDIPTLQEAKEHLRKVIDKDPNNIDARKFLERLYYRGSNV